MVNLEYLFNKNKVVETYICKYKQNSIDICIPTETFGVETCHNILVKKINNANEYSLGRFERVKEHYNDGGYHQCHLNRGIHTECINRYIVYAV